MNPDEYFVSGVFFCLFEFYGIPTFVGYLMPNPFLCKSSISNNSVQSLNVSTV